MVALFVHELCYTFTTIGIHLSICFRVDLYKVCVCIVYLCIATEDDHWRVVETFGSHFITLASEYECTQHYLVILLS